MGYYNNYLLDDCYSYDLSDKQKEYLDACIRIVENKTSIRVASSNFCMSKSHLHRFIHNKLKKISFELYQCVVKQLDFNYKNRGNIRWKKRVH